MSTRAARAAARAPASDASGAAWRVLSLPLRLAALSWGLSTLPLSVLLRLGGRVTRLLDHALAVVGLTRQGRAVAAALANEDTLRQQLRQCGQRLRLAQELLTREQAARRAVERDFALERERSRLRAAAPAPEPRKDLEQSTARTAVVQGALLRMLYLSCLACAVAVIALADAPHLSVERKIVTVGLVPTGITFFSQSASRKRTLFGSLLVLSANWCVVGFVSHLLLRRGPLPSSAADGVLA